MAKLVKFLPCELEDVCPYNAKDDKDCEHNCGSMTYEDDDNELVHVDPETGEIW